MDIKRIGNTIKTLRIKEGYTQQSLADILGVTDKAVSKWERGISAPDISLINKISDVLNIDTNNLIDGNILYLENDWKGLLLIDKFENGIKLDSLLYNKPLVYLYIEYFMLAGIKDIIVRCSDKDKEILFFLVDDLKRFGLNISFVSKNVVIKPDSNLMVLENHLFLYGTGLTKSFQRAMSSQYEITRLISPLIERNYPNSLVDTNNGHGRKSYFRHYRNIPVFFVPKGQVGHYNNLFNFNNDEDICTRRIVPLGTGMVICDIRSYDDLIDISTFIRFIQKNTDMYLYSLEEIAWRRGFISKDELLCFAKSESDSSYSNYLISLCESTEI